MFTPWNLLSVSDPNPETLCATLFWIAFFKLTSGSCLHVCCLHQIFIFYNQCPILCFICGEFYSESGLKIFKQSLSRLSSENQRYWRFWHLFKAKTLLLSSNHMITWYVYVQLKAELLLLGWSCLRKLFSDKFNRPVFSKNQQITGLLFVNWDVMMNSINFLWVDFFPCCPPK